MDFKEWKELLKEQIVEWEDYHSLNRVYLDYKNEKVLNLKALPVVVRKYDLEKKPPKFRIGDGNHKFGFAKKHNISTVMSLVYDIYIIRKSWFNRIIN